MNDSLCLCRLLQSCAALCDREMNGVLEELGISHCQSTMLMQIGSEGPLAMSVLSRKLCCHKSNVTQVVEGLVKKELIDRGASASDRRVCTLALTAKGRAIAEKAKILLEERAREQVSCLAPQDLATLSRILRTIHEARKD